jgi:YcxB-like protein
MEAPSFNISFPFNFWTRYRASLTLLHRLWGTWFAYAFFVGVPTLCFIAAFILGWDLARRGGAFDLPGWALLLGGYAFMFVFMPLLHMFQLWSASRRNRTLLGIQHQALTAEGFSTSGDAFNANLKWDAIHKAIETKHFFFLYVSSRAAYFIPKAHISSASEVDRLRNVLRTYLHDKAQLRATA